MIYIYKHNRLKNHWLKFYPSSYYVQTKENNKKVDTRKYNNLKNIG